LPAVREYFNLICSKLEKQKEEMGFDGFEKMRKEFIDLAIACSARFILAQRYERDVE